MIDLTLFKGQKFAIFGLGKSGISTANALKIAGANVVLWDDNEKSRENAQSLGFQVEDFRSLDFTEFDALILSPGVPLTHPEPHWTVKLAQSSNVEIIGDVALFLEAAKKHGSVKIIAVTGTNGKSTTVSLIHHMLKSKGLDAYLGGNIGTTAVLDMAELKEDRIYVVELSSYQIDLMPKLLEEGFAPDVSVLINVSADHIDRHGTIDHYAEVKSRVFAKQTKDDLSVIGFDDEYGQKYLTQYEAIKPVSVSSNNKNADIYFDDGALIKADEKIAQLAHIDRLSGAHNGQNAAIAYAIGEHFGLSQADIQKSFESFGGLDHRMEYVGRIKEGFGDIIFINDSKATNAEAVRPAIKAFDPIYWIAGGLAKDGGIEPLTSDFDHIEKAYFYGSSKDDFAKTAENRIKYSVYDNLTDCVNKALTEIRHAKQKGDHYILLSPAAASFDQFPNFEKRGKIFKEIAVHLGARA